MFFPSSTGARRREPRKDGYESGTKYILVGASYERREHMTGFFPCANILKFCTRMDDWMLSCAVYRPERSAVALRCSSGDQESMRIRAPFRERRTAMADGERGG